MLKPVLYFSHDGVPLKKKVLAVTQLFNTYRFSLVFLGSTFKPIEGVPTLEEGLQYLVSRAAASDHQADHNYHRLSQF